MADPRSPIETLITVNDGDDRADRSARTHVVTGVGGSCLVLEYERRNGSAGRIRVPMDAVTQALDAAGISPPPRFVKAFWCTDQNQHMFGPFTRRDTTETVARGKGEMGSSAYVGEFTYVVWRDADGVLMGAQALSTPTRIRETEPKDAAIEAALSKLEPDDRAVLEAALSSCTILA